MVPKYLILTLALVLPVAMTAQSIDSGQAKKGETHAKKTLRSSEKKEATSRSSEQGQLSNSDKLFLKTLIREDVSEIGLAKMALKKSANTDVKDYARTKILAADPEMRDGAEKLMRAYGAKPPSGLAARQIKVRDKLSKKSGQYFDAAYMSYEADQQTNDAKLVKTELKSTNNSEIKSYVEKEKTPVDEAASAATDISKKIATAMMHKSRSVAATQGEQQ